MKPKLIKIKGKLNVRATAEAQAKAQEDLTVEDPSDDEAKIILDKAIAEGLSDEKDNQETPQECRTSDSGNSESEKT